MIEGNRRARPSRTRWPLTEHGNAAAVIASVVLLCLLLWRC